MKPTLTTLLFIFFTFFLWGQQPGESGIYRVSTVPNPESLGNTYISEPNNYLTDMEKAEIDRIIYAIEDSTTAQVTVVILTSIGLENPKDFTTRLFNYWGVGKADKDNGLMILSVIDQRRTEFETGYGMEAVLPDVYCYRIGMQELVPHFKEENYGKGIIAALKRIKTILEDPESAEDIRSETRWVAKGGKNEGNSGFFGIPLWLLIYGGITLLFLVIMGIRIITVIRSKDDFHDKYLRLRKNYWLIWIFLFPVPYILIYIFLNRTLRKFRNAPRFSKKDGQPMRRLSEEEEDEFLEKGQITEEEIGSVDYDVWVTEDFDDVLILRYAKRFSKYKKCPKCRFKTYYHAETQTIVPATYSSSGKGEQIHRCKNCGYVRRKTYTIARKQRSSGGGGFRGGGGGGFSGGGFGGGSSGGGGAGVSW